MDCDRLEDPNTFGGQRRRELASGCTLLTSKGKANIVSKRLSIHEPSLAPILECIRYGGGAQDRLPATVEA